MHGGRFFYSCKISAGRHVRAFAMQSTTSVMKSVSQSQFQREPLSLKSQELAGAALIPYIVRFTTMFGVMFSFTRARARASIFCSTVYSVASSGAVESSRPIFNPP